MNLQEKVTACLEAAVANHEAAGVTVLVRRDGQEVLYAQAGMADVAAQRPIRRDSIFRLYSQSKPVTAAAAMLLMERGVIDLMDPVEKYLPGFRGQKVWTVQGLVPAKRPVQVMDLLGMTSGLCYPDGDGAGQYAARLFDEQHERITRGCAMSTVEFANRMGQLPLAFQPGEHFRYGTSADVLGAVVEVASGKAFAAFLEEEFFRPLGMKDTAFLFLWKNGIVLLPVTSVFLGMWRPLAGCIWRWAPMTACLPLPLAARDLCPRWMIMPHLRQCCSAAASTTAGAFSAVPRWII